MFFRGLFRGPFCVPHEKDRRWIPSIQRRPISYAGLNPLTGVRFAEARIAITVGSDHNLGLPSRRDTHQCGVTNHPVTDLILQPSDLKNRGHTLATCGADRNQCPDGPATRALRLLLRQLLGRLGENAPPCGREGVARGQ